MSELVTETVSQEPEDVGKGVGTQEQEPNTEDNFKITKEQFEARLRRAEQAAVKNYKLEIQQQQDADKTQAEKLKGLNEVQKAQLELENAQKRIAELEKANVIADMTKEASVQLTEKLGLSVDASTLDFLVSEDADETQANVESFSKIVNDLSDKKFKQASRGDTPNGFGGAEQSFATKLAQRVNSKKNVEFKNSLFK